MTPGAPNPRPRAARLFVALWPDAATRAALTGRQSRWAWPPGARPTAAPDLHLTLHFLGTVPLDRLADLHTALRSASLPRARPFRLQLDRAALWPSGVAVLAPSRVPSALHRLHDRLAEALNRAGFDTETRPLRPHVTLARQAQGARAPTVDDALRWTVRGFVLAQSDRGYRIVQAYPPPHD